MIKFATIGCNIIIIEKYFKLFLKGSLKHYELNTAEGMILLALYGFNEQIEEANATQDQLIDELHYDKSVMTRSMKSLERKGYVLRKDNPKDSRSYIFNLTDKAFIFQQTLVEILKEWNDIILVNFDDSVLNLLDTMLLKVAKNATGAVRTNNKSE